MSYFHSSNPEFGYCKGFSNLLEDGSGRNSLVFLKIYICECKQSWCFCRVFNVTIHVRWFQFSFSPYGQVRSVNRVLEYLPCSSVDDKILCLPLKNADFYMELAGFPDPLFIVSWPRWDFLLTSVRNFIFLILWTNSCLARSYPNEIRIGTRKHICQKTRMCQILLYGLFPRRRKIVY